MSNVRESKFRAWDYKRKFIYHQGEQYLSSFLRRFISFVTPITNNHEKYIESGSVDKWLMQYTGLLDKNGKEIYEGDIVKAHNGVGEVKFVEGTFHVSFAHPLTRAAELKASEVIGNIYENPELLK